MRGAGTKGARGGRGRIMVLITSLINESLEYSTERKMQILSIFRSDGTKKKKNE